MGQAGLVEHLGAVVVVTVCVWWPDSEIARVIPGREHVAGEEPAVGGQREPPVWSGAQEVGADDGLELADLAGEDGVPDAELACCALEAGLPGDGEEPADALLGARVAECVPDVRW